MTPARLRIRVRGIVQGVGFRPFVFGLAERWGLSGWVRNDGEGVLAEVEGAGADLDAFRAALETEAPPLARIDAVDATSVAPEGRTGFHVEVSGAGIIGTAIGPDAATCPACVSELFDPADRRFGYAFLNCTHCGPRYSITRRLPYDRANTAMAAFAMCEACGGEYGDPRDRRFHAQPTACPACGPHLSMEPAAIRARLRAGEILAIKGLGGFHLAVDARNDAAVAELRRRKAREEKPFAVMVRDLDAARRLVEVDGPEAALLSGEERPVVLLRRRRDGGDRLLAPSVAPGLAWLGVMLPYVPLHHLLFAEDGADMVLVMTSANPGGEPLVIANDEAERRLGAIADAIVSHDRDIVVRVDDSVVRMVDGAPAFLRRARGYVPRAVRLSGPVAPVLAVGGMLKNTVCVTRGDEAFLSQHIGDLDNAATIGFFQETAAHLLDTLQVEPVAVACDLHPDFASTRYARSLGLPVISVSHHHAHVAAIAAEHRIEAPVIGLALDGYGMGEDGGAWGGELLRLDGVDCERLGHFKPLPQPGGDAAARAPWRMGVAALHAVGRRDEAMRRFADRPGLDVVLQLLDKGLNCPPTTSCGRLFDAACGLLGVQPVASFEGQAPMMLEGLVTTPSICKDGFRIRSDGVLDFDDLLRALAACDNPREGAELFHGTLIAALTEWVAFAALKTGLRHVALAGGCMMNQVVAAGLSQALRGYGIVPLHARAAPPGDGGISLGQAWVAARRLG